MGAKERNKGKRGELLLAQLLREHGYDAHRMGQTSGASGVPDVDGIAGLHIECKFVERLNVREALDQASRDARPGEIPVVFHKTSRKPWIVTMTAEDFLRIWKATK